MAINAFNVKRFVAIRIHLGFQCSKSTQGVYKLNSHDLDLVCCKAVQVQTLDHPILENQDKSRLSIADISCNEKSPKPYRTYQALEMDMLKYQPIVLDRPDFRLFRLHRGSFRTDILGELFVAYLDQPESIVPFEALSYTWGDPTPAETICVNHKRLGVTNNLALALQYLCSKDIDRILWIDPICIDQDDDKERGHQVQQMGKIYAFADRVICWLGLATYETNVVMESLHSLQEASINIACRDWKSSDERWVNLWASIQPALAERHSHLQDRQQKGLKSLLQRAWFERVWIVQEVVNAKAAYIQCGEKSVSTRILGLAPTLLDVALGPQQKAVLDIMPGPLRRYSW